MPWVAYWILRVDSSRFGTSLIQTLLVTLGVLAGIGINFYVIWSTEMATGLFAP